MADNSRATKGFFGSDMTPAGLAVGTVLLLFGLLNVVEVYRQTTWYPIIKTFLGQDSLDSCKAGTLVREGEDPYQRKRTVTPPLSSVLFSLIIGLGPQAIATLMFGANLLFVLIGCWLATRIHPWDSNQRWLLLLSLLVLVLFSMPVHFIIDRGNIDAAVMLLVMLSAWSVFKWKRGIIGGVFLGLAIGMKIYPIVLCGILLVQRRFRVVLAAVATVALLTALMPSLSWEWLSARVLTRAAEWGFTENGSLANAMQVLVMGVHLLLPSTPLPPAGMILWEALYLILLAAALFMDLFSNCRERFSGYNNLLMYFPYMVAYPRLSFLYEYISLLALLPVLCDLWRRANCRAWRILVIVSAIGLGVSQMQSMAWSRVLGEGLIGSLAVFLPAWGMVTMMIAFLGLRILALRQNSSLQADLQADSV